MNWHSQSYGFRDSLSNNANQFLMYRYMLSWKKSWRCPCVPYQKNIKHKHTIVYMIWKPAAANLPKKVTKMRIAAFWSPSLVGFCLIVHYGGSFFSSVPRGGVPAARARPHRPAGVQRRRGRGHQSAWLWNWYEWTVEQLCCSFKVKSPPKKISNFWLKHILLA